jgi:hypothetical protein
MEDNMRRKPGLSRSEIRARDRLIRTALGRVLAAQYDLAEPPSERLAALLERFEETSDIGADKTALVQCGSTRTTSSRAGAKPELAST